MIFLRAPSQGMNLAGQAYVQNGKPVYLGTLEGTDFFNEGEPKICSIQTCQSACNKWYGPQYDCEDFTKQSKGCHYSCSSKFK